MRQLKWRTIPLLAVLMAGSACGSGAGEPVSVGSSPDGTEEVALQEEGARQPVQLLLPDGTPFLVVDSPQLEEFPSLITLVDRDIVNILQKGGTATLRAPAAQAKRSDDVGDAAPALRQSGQLVREGDDLPGTEPEYLDWHRVSEKTWKSLKEAPKNSIQGMEVANFEASGLAIRRDLRGSLQKSLKPVLSAGGEELAFGGPKSQAASPWWVTQAGQQFLVVVTAPTLVSAEVNYPSELIYDQVAQATYVVAGPVDSGSVSVSMTYIDGSKWAGDITKESS